MKGNTSSRYAAKIWHLGTVGFSDILQHLREFFAVCDTLGLRAEAEGGRFSIYHEWIRHLSEKVGRLRAGEPKGPIYAELATDLLRYLVALAESQEVGAMVPFLRTGSHPVLASRLKTVLAGPELPSEEDQASNQARNIQFELWLATTLWQGGASVVLAEPDLHCRIGDVTVLIACKRIISVGKLTQRINEATAQLKRGLASLPRGASGGF
jgi:hypothetical protein